MSILSFENVSFQYAGNNAPTILKDVSIGFESGTFYSIIGPSGSGKTTALSLAGGLDVPTSGKVLFQDQDIAKIGYTKHRRHNVALVFQNYNLIPYLNALENVVVAMEITNTYKGERKEKALQLLSMVGLTGEDIHRPVTKLSGGQQQRVAIARSLAGDAPIVLADEPTGNLDENSAAEIIQIFQKLAKEMGRCVIVVSHSTRVAKASDAIICFKNNTLQPLNNPILPDNPEPVTPAEP